MSSARGGRRHSDDATAPALLHAGEEALDRQEGGGKITLHGDTPVLVADVFQRGRLGEAAACIGNENVDRAQLVFDFTSHRLDVREFRDVCCDTDHMSPGMLDLTPYSRQGRWITAVNDDIRTLACKHPSNAGPDAARTAGDKSDLVL